MATFQKMMMQQPPPQPQQVNIRPPAPVGQMAQPPQEPDADDFGPATSPPPTARDAKQSITHHISSIKYNAKHAAAHQDETARHSTALLNLLKNVPGFAEHAKKV